MRYKASILNTVFRQEIDQFQVALKSDCYRDPCVGIIIYGHWPLPFVLSGKYQYLNYKLSKSPSEIKSCSLTRIIGSYCRTFNKLIIVYDSSAVPFQLLRSLENPCDHHIFILLKVASDTSVDCSMIYVSNHTDTDAISSSKNAKTMPWI